MLLMTGNTRSGGVSQGRPEGAAPAVGAQRRALTDAGAESTRHGCLGLLALLFPVARQHICRKAALPLGDLSEVPLPLLRWEQIARHE